MCIRDRPRIGGRPRRPNDIPAGEEIPQLGVDISLDVLHGGQFPVSVLFPIWETSYMEETLKARGSYREGPPPMARALGRCSLCRCLHKAYPNVYNAERS